MVLKVSDTETPVEADSLYDADTSSEEGRHYYLPRPPDRPIFAKSPAYNLLSRELKRFRARDIRGRSFLISGHRGSGKTTLVLRAIEDLIRGVRRIEEWVQAGLPLASLWLNEPDMAGMQDVWLEKNGVEDLRRRPLLVKLHGPTILSPSINSASEGNGQESDSTDQGETDDESDSPQDPSDKAAQAVLIQITIALYRELCAEMTTCYRSKAMEFAAETGSKDVIEQVGQLCLELDNAPEPALLREFWSRIDALSTGVLWDFSEDSDTTGRQFDDSGIRELVALSTAAQAYRVVSGSIKYERGKKGSVDNESTKKSELVPAIKEFANPFLSLITGGLVGGATFASKGDPGISAVVGLATLLLTSLTLTFASSRTAKRSETREYTFIRDYKVETLDRELPIVIDRIRAAGLDPVFVVDELDKVEKLDEHMMGLVERLKHLVADNSFFCFLTDRDYFEGLRERSRVDAYPKEHTYFSHRLFVLYRPKDIQEYLERLIRIEDPSDLDSLKHQFAMTYLLKHRAMMHTFDLQRELAKVSDDKGIIEISYDDVTGQRGYRYHMMIQMAIEHLLGEPELAERLEQDAQFGQLTYDALYMPSRSWVAGDEYLDVSDHAIEKYLRGRLLPLSRREENPDQELQTIKNGNDIESAGSPLEDDPPSQENLLRGLVRDTDREYLIDLIRELVAMLADPEILKKKVKDRARSREGDTGANPLQSLADTIPQYDEMPADGNTEDDESDDLRLIVAVKKDEEGRQDQGASKGDEAERDDEANRGPLRYRWYRDPFGRQLLHKGEKPEKFVNKSSQIANDQFLERFTSFLVEAGGPQLDPHELGLCGVIPATPTWDFVSQARARLIEFRETESHYDEILDDQDTVREYVGILSRHGEQVFASLTISYLVQREAGLEDKPENSFAAFRALSTILNPHGVDTEKVGQRLRSYYESLGFPRDFAPPLRRGAFEEWSARYGELTAMIKDRSVSDLSEHRDIAWRDWRGQLDGYFATGTFEPTRSLSRAACLAAGVTPDCTSLRSPSDMTIREASDLAVSAIKGHEAESAEYVPIWALLPMLRLLGIVESPGSARSMFEHLARLSESESTRRQFEAEIERTASVFAGGEPAKARRSVLILSSEEESTADHWPLSQHYGVIILTSSALSSETGPNILPIVSLVFAAQLEVAIVDLHERTLQEVEGMLRQGTADIADDSSPFPTVYMSPYARDLKEEFPQLDFIVGDRLDTTMIQVQAILNDMTGDAGRPKTKKKAANKKPAKKKGTKKATKGKIRRKPRPR